MAAEADTAEGLFLSPKSFTAAVLACCANDMARKRLFRSLRGEGEWTRCGGDSEGGSIGREHERRPYRIARSVWARAASSYFSLD